MLRYLLSWLLGLGGAVLGGVLGYLAFHWVLKYGVEALVLPGAMVGIGCALLSRHNSVLRGVLCGLAGLAVGVYAEWSHFPFTKDQSIEFFVTHLHKLSPITLILIVLGGIVAFWFGRTYFRGPAPEQHVSS